LPCVYLVVCACLLLICLSYGVPGRLGSSSSIRIGLSVSFCTGSVYGAGAGVADVTFSPRFPRRTWGMRYVGCFCWLGRALIAKDCLGFGENRMGHDGWGCNVSDFFLFAKLLCFMSGVSCFLFHVVNVRVRCLLLLLICSDFADVMFFLCSSLTVGTLRHPGDAGRLPPTEPSSLLSFLHALPPLTPGSDWIGQRAFACLLAICFWVQLR